MFHSSDGLYFEKLADGAVRIIKRETAHADAPLVFDKTIDKDTWASVIAQMSFYGEEHYGFNRATYFHYGEPMRATSEWSMLDDIAKREKELLCK